MRVRVHPGLRPHGSALLSRVTSSVRYGGLRDSGEELLLRRLRILHRRTLPHGVSSHCQPTSGLRAGALEWPTPRMCTCVVLVGQRDRRGQSATSGRHRADGHRSAPPDRPQGFRSQGRQDRNGG
ncbi:hypothetical protein P376_1203 [Streptomyces sp. HCCB10043]|nr:hypothetical protein P376_1203 [Streptomyces sp. HCCB10043]